MTNKLHKKVIINDTFDIAARLKEIDPTYFVVRDLRLNRWEVHSSAQSDTLCAVLPFDSLDCRAVDYIRRTRSERQAELVAELERENSRLERQELARIIDRVAL